MWQGIGKILILSGIIITLIGLGMYFFHDKLTWFGKLPGDIRYEKGHVKFFAPIVSMLLLSIALTIIINLIKKLF